MHWLLLTSRHFSQQLSLGAYAVMALACASLCSLAVVCLESNYMVAAAVKELIKAP